MNKKKGILEINMPDDARAWFSFWQNIFYVQCTQATRSNDNGTKKMAKCVTS